jgi:uncharacterized protein (TIRG00374 family)
MLPDTPGGKKIPQVRWQAWLGIALSLACLLWVLREVDFISLWQAARQLNLLYVVVVNLLYAASFAVRTIRWQLLLAPIKQAGFAPLFSANIIGFMANNLLPARLGELVRALVAARLTKTPLAGTLASLVMERMLDGPVVLGFIMAVLFSLDPKAGAGPLSIGALRTAGLSLFLVWLAILALLTAAVLWPQKVAQGVGGLAARMSPRLGVRLRQLLLTFGQGLSSLRRPGLLLRLLLLSMGVRAFIFLMHTVFLAAVGLPINLMLGAMATLAALLATSMPAAPGSIGAFQLATYWALVMVGAPEQQAMAYSILYWAVQYFPLVAVGMVETYRQGLNLSVLSHGGAKLARA